ncbi:MAG: aminotransferase class V-fold PLP-dependent enzyme [Thermomicrobiales bacterium]|nr:aminotransferase class V-fold PLP-dependent enzyme [Thermomicrobiales bacterium]
MAQSVPQQLGVRPVINAAATLTKLGGSIMPPEVVAAMSAASGNFVDMFEYMDKVGERLAELTHNEAAFVSSGAAAGIALCVASCIAGTDPSRQQSFPYLEGIDKTNVVVYKRQRNPYDYAARQTGARLVEIEPDGDDLEREVANPKTACVLYFGGEALAPGARPLPEVIEIAHSMSVPVIVDGAAQIPPISNLWYYTRDLGADAAIFSGGKGLRGPQSSGLVVGKKAIIDGIRPNAAPNQSFGRPMKVGKEELAGLLTAVELALKQDEPALLASYEASVRLWNEGLAGIPGVTAERRYPSEAGQPHGRTIVTLDESFPKTRDQVIDELWNRDPRIAVSPIDTNAFALNPQTLETGEDRIVLDAVRDVLTTATKGNR